MSLKILYIDENPTFHETIAKHLNHLEKVESLHCFNSIKRAVKHLKEQEVNIIIIDPNFTKENGFSFIEKKVKNQLFIFHSARTKDAVKGYELGIFDFLPKPFTIDRFSITLKRLYQQEYILEKQRSILPSTYIEVRCDLMKERILHDDISHIEAMGDYVKIVTDNRKYVVLMSMKKIEELLPEKFFFRTHKSFIVNSKKIENFTAREVVLKKVKVPLSRFKKLAFIDHMLEI
jgi:DNA-binding LytR/AlgR family response regulator